MDARSWTVTALALLAEPTDMSAPLSAPASNASSRFAKLLLQYFHSIEP
jgi:hypothetical protein